MVGKEYAYGQNVGLIVNTLENKHKFVPEPARQAQATESVKKRVNV